MAQLFSVVPPERRSSNQCTFSDGEPSLMRNDCYPLSFAFANEPRRTVMKKVVCELSLLAQLPPLLRVQRREQQPAPLAALL